jgi:anionic cell wall polymer biosynthesis LytR-Cps2A-Psr (LCP) family protein
MRNRTNSNDATRMVRQRCTVRAVAAQASPATIALRFPQIAKAVMSSTTTDVPLSLLPELIEYAASLDASDIATAAFGYPGHAPRVDVRSLPIVDVGRVQATVQEMLAAVEAGVAPDGGSLGDECSVSPSG